MKQSHTLCAANKLLADHSKSYEECVQQLREFMFTISVTKENNPIVLNLETFDHVTLENVIVEYTAFLNESIHMLLDARLRCYSWKGLADEVDDNIEEEKGLKTRQVPHLEMMRKGFREDLDIEIEHRRISNVTKGFLTKMKSLFRQHDNPYLAGALLALEGTAVPEFYTLEIIVVQFLKLRGKELKKGTAKDYIDGHKLFEVGHEQGLMDSIKPYITPENMQNFVRGYLAVCLAIHVWWNQIYYHQFSLKATLVRSSE